MSEIRPPPSECGIPIQTRVKRNNVAAINHDLLPTEKEDHLDLFGSVSQPNLLVLARCHHWAGNLAHRSLANSICQAGTVTSCDLDELLLHSSSSLVKLEGALEFHM